LSDNVSIESIISDLISKDLIKSHLEGDFEDVFDLITIIGDLIRLYKNQISQSSLRTFVKQIFEISIPLFHSAK